MAKNHYPEELTSLVEEYLTDGIISAKERQVLLNKAEKLGIDVDEFDLYIDAQQQKVDQQVDSAVAKKRGKTCPFCGSTVPQLTDKCPECGQYITPEASKELEVILERLEDALVDFKAGRDIERNKAIVEKYSRKARMYYSNHPKIKAILAEVDSEISAVEFAVRKQAIIKGTIKNKKFWSAVAIITGIVFMILGFHDYQMLEFSILGFFILGGGFFSLID